MVMVCQLCEKDDLGGLSYNGLVAGGITRRHSLGVVKKFPGPNYWETLAIFLGCNEGDKLAITYEN